MTAPLVCKHGDVNLTDTMHQVNHTGCALRRAVLADDGGFSALIFFYALLLKESGVRYNWAIKEMWQMVPAKTVVLCRDLPQRYPFPCSDRFVEHLSSDKYSSRFCFKILEVLLKLYSEQGIRN